MTNQLGKIIENFGTNELVRTNTHNKSLVPFITKINQLIHLFKQEQQKMLKKETELKQEITNISHDLRTPLTSMKGFSELLTDSTLSEAERKEYLAIIQKKIDNLIMMADAFYELSQVDSSNKQLKIEQQFIDKIIIENMLLFYADFEKNQLRVDIEEVPVSPIFADKKAANRIVINIIQNALRYAKNYFKIAWTEDERYVHFIAINDVDTPDHTELKRIFDRTFKMDSSRTGGELGLGLHIVEQLIHKQDGKVAADLHDNEFKIDIAFKKWDSCG